MAGRAKNTSAFVISSLLCLQLAAAFTPATFTKRISTRSPIDLEIQRIGPLAALNRNNDREIPRQKNDRDMPSRPFGELSSKGPMRDSAVRSLVEANSEVEFVESMIDTNEEQNVQLLEQRDQKSTNFMLEIFSKLTGAIDEDRLLFPELVSGEVPRTFSNISFEKNEADGNMITQALHAPGSIIGAAALVSGTTIGAGVLALPTATAPAGFLASSAALCIAWFYMTISGLLIAELAINRMGETGRVGVGLLELYKASLGKELSWIAISAYLFLHYAVMVAYLSQGGANLGVFMDNVGFSSLSSIHGLDQFIFTAAAGSLVYFAKPSVVENVNNTLVLAVIASFLCIIGVGAGSADFSALIAPINQHPELVVDAFPICFLSMVFHNVVPTVVTQLEGDRTKITKALIIGTLIPLIMLLSWNGIILGNIVSIPGAFDNGLDPIAFLQSEGIGGEKLGALVSVFSELAITTSVIGFIYGLLDSLTDVFNLPLKGAKFEQWKPALFAGVLVPPFIFSLGNPDVFFDALDYGGAFGVSTLFLVLPPIMVWKQRYGEEDSVLTVPPMVPFGKIPLASLWKAAGTLILEQGAAKLGVFDFFSELSAEQGWFK